MKHITSFLKEQQYRDLCYIYQNVNESGGLYDGQIELATHITDDIVKETSDSLSSLLHYI